MQEQFDAVVIGSGQGGTPLAKAMAGHGWKTALIERRFVGGVCMNDGCTPTKTMVASARVAALAARGEEYGVLTGAVRTDLAKVVARSQRFVQHARGHLEESLRAVEGLQVIYGDASFAEAQPRDGSGHALEIRAHDGGTQTITAARVFVDVGERPQLPKIEGLESTPYYDSTSMLLLEALPEHLLILGGGYIAIEFAQSFRRFGAKVTIVEHHTQILEREDEDLARCLEGILQEDGIEVLLGVKASAVRTEEGGVALSVESEGHETRELHGTHLLVATGRVPNTETLRLERVGVEVDEKQFIRVNERLETSVPGIWAMGDVTGGPPFTHVSYDDFRVLRTNLLQEGAEWGAGSGSTAGRLVPYAIFTDPELGRVGLSEKEARAQGLDFKVAAAPMRMTARAAEMGETRGMMKAIVDRKTNQLLGAAILGVNGGEVATELQLAMLGGLTADQVREAIFIHPVLAEGLHVLFRSYRE